ncbi:MAG: hypothetical protein ACYTF0_03450 [Planctomycetota bacterium]|jgi:hypothetical protein
MHRIAVLSLLLPVLLLGPLGAAQTLAWLGMAISYSLEDGLSQGLDDTFSGERPCSLCHAVSTAQGDDHHDGTVRRLHDDLRQPLSLAPSPLALIPSLIGNDLPAIASAPAATSWHRTPPRPPPRL